MSDVLTKICTTMLPHNCIVVVNAKDYYSISPSRNVDGKTYFAHVGINGVFHIVPSDHKYLRYIRKHCKLQGETIIDWDSYEHT